MFYDVFEKLCKANGISCKKAAMDIGLSNSTATKWKKNGATPKSETLYKIASYFGVTIGQLLEKDQSEQAPSEPAAQQKFAETEQSKMEAELLEIFDQLPQDAKEMLLAQLRGLANAKAK